MLRYIYLFLLFLFTGLGLSSAVSASRLTDNISVTAEPQKVSATTIGKNLYFSKQFNLLVANLGKETIDLSQGCFIGYDRSNRAYFIDIIDEKLNSSQLAKQKSIQGIAIFSSDNEQVQSIQYVKFEDKCN